MSTDFRLLKRVLADELFDGRLEEFGVHEHMEPGSTTKTTRCLIYGCPRSRKMVSNGLVA